MIASHRSRRWKSGSAPLIFTASSHTTDCRPPLRLPVELHERRLARPRSTNRKVWTPKPSMNRNERGIARSDIAHISMWVDSGMQRHEVPEVVVRGLRLREAAVGLLLRRVDQVGELDRVLDEEHRDVVADEVPVALLGVELHREAAHVAGQVGRTLVAGDGREAHEHRRALAGTLEQVGAGHVRRATRSSRSSRARRSRGRARRARGSARGRSGRSSRGSGSPRAPRDRGRRRASVFWSSATGTPCAVVRMSSSVAIWCGSPPLGVRAVSIDCRYPRGCARKPRATLRRGVVRGRCGPFARGCRASRAAPTRGRSGSGP